MLFLALLCAGIGLFPLVVLPLVEGAARAAGAAGRVALHAPVGTLGVANLTVLACIAAVAAVLARRTARAAETAGAASSAGTDPSPAEASVPTWDCGYARPTPRMQYTASSFAAWNVGFFRWSLLPRTEISPPRGPFPGSARFTEHVPDAVLDRVLLPATRGISWLLTRARVIQRGHLQLYLVYIVATLLLLLSRV